MSKPYQESEPEKLRSINSTQARQIAEQYGSPVYAYNEAILKEKAREVLAFGAPYGLTVRYAMKANPLKAILQLFHAAGLQVDASSGHEVSRAMAVGIPADHILLTSQELPENLKELVGQGMQFNATSLHQLSTYGTLFPGSEVAVRINPNVGSGHSRKVDTGGPTSSFGIWYENIAEVKSIAERYNLTVTKLHTHIGAGNDPQVWHEAARITLEIAEQFPTVTAINLGGGFKVARISHEKPTEIAAVSHPVNQLLEDFASKTGRKLHLEIEPGTFMVANSGSIISRVADLSTTGSTGFDFIKLDTGLTEFTRPAMYGSQHAIVVVNDRPKAIKPYVVVGHTCESADLLTPDAGETDVPTTRLLQEASIGDIVVIEGTGAYCSGMSFKGYNSYPEPAEIIFNGNEIKLVKKPASFEEQLAREL